MPAYLANYFLSLEVRPELAWVWVFTGIQFVFLYNLETNVYNLSLR